MGFEVKARGANAEWPALLDAQNATLAALMFQLNLTQWWSPEKILAQQLLQLAELLRYAYEAVPFYRRRFDELGFRPSAALNMETWRALPLLTRRDIQSAGIDLASRAVPIQCGAVREVQTSGSTGEPVKLRRTQLDHLFWQAATVRDHLWHQRDLSCTLAAIRIFPSGIGAFPTGTPSSSWGDQGLINTGPAMLLSLTTDVENQAAWLAAQNPEYLITYPTNLAALLDVFRRRDISFARLRGVTTIGETVTAELRTRCQAALKAPLTDIYSSQEFGYLALQCPIGDRYHVMAESALVEILDDRGNPCLPGAVGRLVISSLHNFATPLIRYELGDYAEAGLPCVCGRGLPTLTRIAGRTRNMLLLPSGERHWPLVGFAEFRAVAPVRQYQLVQHAVGQIEVRLVVDRPLTARDEATLTQIIQTNLGWPFELQFIYFDCEIPRNGGGKFEEFLCKIEKNGEEFTRKTQPQEPPITKRP